MSAAATPELIGEERVHEVEGRAVEDWRTDAQTDIDRISYAPEFRRLAGVTQVIPPQDDYLFHDRLTHSMKVAQVAATIARKIVFENASHGPVVDAGLNIDDWIHPDYCYAAGLAHDIGHPPYGHAGEQELQRILRTGKLHSASRRSFEGNAQSTHIVATLSFRKADPQGLNLTLRSMAAIAKYPWTRGQHPRRIAKLAKKWSFYPEEEFILDRLLGKFIAVETSVYEKDLPDGHEGPRDRVVGVDKVHRWPEAEVMDWADDVSYAVHDMEDFFKSGRIPLHTIRAALLLPLPNADEAETDPSEAAWLTTTFKHVQDTEVRRALIYARGKMLAQLDPAGVPIGHFVPEAFASILASIANHMPASRFDGSEQAHTDLQKFGSTGISYLTSLTSVKVVEVENVTRVQFVVDPVATLVAEFFKALCQFYVIESSALSTMQSGQAQSVRNLVNELTTMSQNWVNEAQGTIPARLRTYLERQQDGRTTDAEATSATQIAVIDYVCSLRDLQANLLETIVSGRSSSLSVSSEWLDS